MSEKVKYAEHFIIERPLVTDRWSTLWLGTHTINVQDESFLNMDDVANKLFGKSRWHSDTNLYINREGMTVLIWKTSVENTFRVSCRPKEMAYLMKRRGVGKMDNKVTEDDLVYELSQEFNGGSYIYCRDLEIAYQKISAGYCALSNINADTVKARVCDILQVKCVNSAVVM